MRTRLWTCWVSPGEYAALDALRGHWRHAGQPTSRADLLRALLLAELATPALPRAAEQDPACAAALVALEAEPEPGATGAGRPPRVRAGT